MANIDQLEKILNCQFKDKNLILQALVHRSYLNENPKFKLDSNERLEFLGDAVLEFITSLLLYQQLPDYSEGNLTNVRSCLVRTEALAEIARKLNLGDYLLLSRGEEELGGRSNATLLANSFEALTGAIFLDQGIEKVKEFLNGILLPVLKQTIQRKRFKDFKSLFQELIQSQEKITPQYTVLKEIGPDHNKIFTVGLWVGKKLWAKGTGKSKLEAEEKAAEIAFKKTPR